MFVDMVGSTNRLHKCDPEEFFEFITEYQSRVKICVSKFQGNVARFIGDGVLVYFGWPQALEDGAARAIRTGEEIISSISDLLDPHAEATACRIGIATGVVVVGEISTQPSQHQDEIFGEVPHLAERLQGIGRPNSILVCQQTQKLAKNEFHFHKVPNQILKGIEEKQTAYVAKAEKRNVSRFVAKGKSRQLKTFGRGKELKNIERLWQKSTAGDGQIVWICGDAGIGKSHLVEAVHKSLPHENLMTVRYQCSRFNTQSPYYPFVRRTEIWAGINVGDPPDLRLKKFIERIGDVPDGEMLRNISAMMGFPEVKTDYAIRSEQEEKEAVCRSLLHLLKIAIRQYSTLILIEDIHWADPSSLGLVKYINDNSKQINALILVTHRDEIDIPNQKSDNFHQLNLGPLDKADSRKMVIDVASENSPDNTLVDAIVDKTDGIPLYVDACTRAYLDASDSRSGENSFQGKTDVPFSLHDILMERLDRLGDSKATAQICSAIGYEFTADIVHKISNRPLAEIENDFASLTNANIFICGEDGDIPNYRFRHWLIQDVAYQGLLKRSRRQLHLTIARVFENELPELVQNEPELIAEHFRVAERYPQAIKYLLAAATKGIAKFANREAIDHADQAIVLIRKLDTQSEKEKLELEFQMIKALAGRALHGFAKKSTIVAFQRMMELATKHSSARHYSRAIRGLFNSLHTEGRYNDALEMAERLIDGSSDDPHGRMTAHHMRAVPLIWQGKFVEANQEIDTAISIIGNFADQAKVNGNKIPAQIHSTKSIAMAFLGNYEAAYNLSLEALQQAKHDGNPLEIANSYLSACNALRIIRHPKALHLARECQEFIADHEIPYYSAALPAFLGLALFEDGDRSTGLELLKEGWEQFLQTNSRLNQVFYMAELADCYLQVGNISEAESAVENGFALMIQYDERNFEAELHRIRAEIFALKGDRDQSRIVDEYEKAIKIAGLQKARIFELRASISLVNYVGQGKHNNSAVLQLRETCSQFGDNADFAELARARELVSQPRQSTAQSVPVA